MSGDIINPDYTDRNDGYAYSNLTGVFTVQKGGEYDLVIFYNSNSPTPGIDLVIDDTAQPLLIWETNNNSPVPLKKGQYAHSLMSKAFDLTKGQRWWLVNKGANIAYSDLIWFLRLE